MRSLVCSSMVITANTHACHKVYTCYKTPLPSQVYTFRELYSNSRQFLPLKYSPTSIK